MRANAGGAMTHDDLAMKGGGVPSTQRTTRMLVCPLNVHGRLFVIVHGADIVAPPVVIL